MKRALLAIVLVAAAATVAGAQTPPAAAGPGSAAAPPAAAGAGSGSGSAAAPAPAAPDAAALRKTCTDAMNADPSFRESVIQVASQEIAVKYHNADVEVEKLHQDAFDRIKTNERHVIMAYAAMWIAAVLFVVFLWRRQQGLVRAIDDLQRELDAAIKADGSGAKS